MLLEHRFAWLGEFHSDELESFGFKSSDDVADKSTLDTVWLDHDVGSLSWHFDF